MSPGCPRATASERACLPSDWRLPFRPRIWFHANVLRRPPTFAHGGLLACSHPLAAEAGVRMLREGGHAVDAIVAAGAVLAVVEPSASGIGGDAFFLVAESGRAPVALNGSGAAPRALTADHFAGAVSVPLRSPSSCTTPGCVRAWWDAWSRWGRLPWATVLAPALSHAREGFPISWRMGQVNSRLEPVLLADPGLRAVYAPQGRAHRAGDVCRPGALAGTLEAIASLGASAFYEGPIAAQLAAGTRAAGGMLSADDLADHTTVVATPYRSELESGTLFEQPLPSQGILLSIMASLMDGGLDTAIERPAEELHRQCQAKQIAFALRDAFLTDPAHLPVPEEQLVAALLDVTARDRLRRLIEEEPIPLGFASAMTVDALNSTPAGRDLVAACVAAGFDPACPPRPGDAATDTTYLCAADRDGNQVGLIQSIFHVYGSGFLEPSTGVLLNNRACGFSLDPRHINALRPGKRSLHTLNSFLLKLHASADGRAEQTLVGGTPGGDNQVQTNLQVLRHLLAGRDLFAGPPPEVEGKWTQRRRARSDRARPPWFDLLSVALESPRWRHDPDGSVRIEARMPAEIRKRLRHWGHDVVRIGPWEGSGIAQLISTQSAGAGAWLHVGATDPRGEGLVLGI